MLAETLEEKEAAEELLAWSRATTRSAGPTSRDHLPEERALYKEMVRALGQIQEGQQDVMALSRKSPARFRPRDELNTKTVTRSAEATPS